MSRLLSITLLSLFACSTDKSEKAPAKVTSGTTNLSKTAGRTSIATNNSRSSLAAPSKAIDQTLLTGSWTRDDNGVFVPTKSKTFEVTEWRPEMSFNEDGTGKYLVLSPNDAHYFVDTKWKLQGADLTITVTASKESFTKVGTTYEHRIASLSPGKLRLAK